MFNLSNRVYPNIQRILKNSKEGVLFIFKEPLIKSWIPKKSNEVKLIQVRCKSTLPPPPGVSPFEPQKIPFARPGQNHGPPSGTLWMLWVPFIAFGLGTWQVKRLKWKTQLINAINERSTMDPVPLTTLDPNEVAQMEFQKVKVTGTFDHENEILYGPKPCLINGEPNVKVLHKTGEGGYGYNLVTPFILSDSGEKILVNRGWICTKTVSQAKRPWSKTEGEQTIVGVVRTAEPLGIVAPATDPKFKIWHFRDIQDMAKHTKSLPIYIDATVDHSIPNHLWAGQTMTSLRNEHMSYIVTWYSLGLATSYMWYARYMKK